jgi:hypothetical protein
MDFVITRKKIEESGSGLPFFEGKKQRSAPTLLYILARIR